MNSNYRCNITIRIQEIEERTFGIEDTKEEIESLVRENIKDAPQ